MTKEEASELSVLLLSYVMTGVLPNGLDSETGSAVEILGKPILGMSHQLIARIAEGS